MTDKMRTPKVGEKFTVRSTSAWRSGSSHGTEVITHVIEIVEVTEWHMNWRTVEVVSVENPLPGTNGNVPSTGGYSLPVGLRLFWGRVV